MIINDRRVFPLPLWERDRVRGFFGLKVFNWDKISTSIKGNTETRYPEKKTGLPNVDVILSLPSTFAHETGS